MTKNTSVIPGFLVVFFWETCAQSEMFSFALRTSSSSCLFLQESVKIEVEFHITNSILTFLYMQKHWFKNTNLSSGTKKICSAFEVRDSWSSQIRKKIEPDFFGSVLLLSESQLLMSWIKAWNLSIFIKSEVVKHHCSVGKKINSTLFLKHYLMWSKSLGDFFHC